MLNGQEQGEGLVMLKVTTPGAKIMTKHDLEIAAN